MVDSQTLGVVVVAVVLVIGVVGLFLYLSRRLARRREQILTDLKDKPELVQDRAFNRLAMARREAAVVGRTGADVLRAQGLIAESQSAFDLRQYPRAYELAQSAHESLVSVQRGTAPLPSARNPPRAAMPGSTSPAPTSPPPAAPMPRNRAESHFELGLLDQELETARKDRPTQGGTLEAQSLRNQAQAAFDRSDFTEAFRLALRARRGLGGHVESLAPGPIARSTAARTATDDAAGTAEQAAAAERCPHCGYPTSPTDAFCRGCGTPRKASACSNCGAERTAADTFCGRCGTRFDV